MAAIDITGSNTGSALKEILLADDIEVGSIPSYQLCKLIYVYHPLGAKMVDKPIAIAQSQSREISIPGSPEDRVRKQFLEEWESIGADMLIFNTMSVARCYGVAAVAVIGDGTDLKPQDPLDYTKLAKQSIAFNILDPLNTAGSIVLNQDPNNPAFQKVQNISIAGIPYHRSRSCIVMNESPLYIQYVPSAFGFSGRSVYQRGLLPLKSFAQSMITDDMVTRKAGLLIAMMKQVGSIVTQAMQVMFGGRRALLQEAKTDNVLSIGSDEKIETLNMQNLDGAYGMARRNILENLAASDNMPAVLLVAETFGGDFHEGTEDARNLAQYVDRFRISMRPLYAFFDKIVQYRAWNEEFFKTVKNDFPEQYGHVDYQTAFYQWVNAFTATWPSLLIEPDSERIKTDDVKLKALIATIQVLIPDLDPENRALVLQWFADNVNENRIMFKHPLELDIEALRAYQPEQQQSSGDGDDEPKPAHPFAAQDAAVAPRVIRINRRQVTQADVQRIVDEAMLRKPAWAAGAAE